MKRWYFFTLTTLMVSIILCEVLPSYVLLVILVNAVLCGIQMEVMRKRTSIEFQHKLEKERRKEAEIIISESEYSAFADEYCASHKEA